jgi:hypothetical protein
MLKTEDPERILRLRVYVPATHWAHRDLGGPLEPQVIGLKDNQTAIDVTYELAEML